MYRSRLRKTAAVTAADAGLESAVRWVFPAAHTHSLTHTHTRTRTRSHLLARLVRIMSASSRSPAPRSLASLASHVRRTDCSSLRRPVGCSDAPPILVTHTQIAASHCMRRSARFGFAGAASTVCMRIDLMVCGLIRVTPWMVCLDRVRNPCWNRTGS